MPIAKKSVTKSATSAVTSKKAVTPPAKKSAAPVIKKKAAVTPIVKKPAPAAPAKKTPVKTSTEGSGVEKEIEILQLLCNGKTVGETADKLKMNSRTLEGKMMLLREYHKAISTTHLCCIALRKGLVD